MNRIEETFAKAKREKRAVLVGYLTAGDPDRATSMADLRAALKHGVDILELGVPFSDPTADGPEIQQSSQRALAAGTTLRSVLEMARELRKETTAPMILFGYANPFYRYGFEALARDAAAAGVDGFLVVDLPPEESGEFDAALAGQALCLVPLIAPTTSMARAGTVLRAARGFVYYIMVRGVTGARAAVASDAAGHLATLRTCTPLPIVAGFGVSRGEQARAVAAAADGVVVGSALVAAARAGRLADLVRELRAALAG